MLIEGNRNKGENFEDTENTIANKRYLNCYEKTEIKDSIAGRSNNTYNSAQNKLWLQKKKLN